MEVVLEKIAMATKPISISKPIFLNITHYSAQRRPKSKEKSSKKSIKEQNLTRLFSFAQGEFDQINPSTQDLALSYSEENVEGSEHNQEPQNYSESEFTTNKEQNLMKEVEYLD